jgi:pimeloyl-ACP methyl ester carboxylesterase
MIAQALVVLAIHGGGWVTYGPDSIQPYADGLQRRGVPAVAVPYTLYNLPQAIMDIRRQVRQYRAQGRCVVLYGFSGGGTLAAYLAARGEAPAVVEGGITDLVTLPRFGYLGTPQHYRDARVLGQEARWSPTRRVVARPSPMLALYGDLDQVIPVSQGVRLVRSAGARLVIKRGGGHVADSAYGGLVKRWIYKRSGCGPAAT